MIPIIIFHHGVFVIENKILENGIQIAWEQMKALEESGLLEAASELHVGVNGGSESEVFVKGIFPDKAQVMYHGLESRAENLTITALWERANKVEGEAYFFYEHQKGSSHEIGSEYGDSVARPWREAMTADLVNNWRQCIVDLDSGYDIACSHWMWNMADGTQHIPAGNFLWVRASFVRKLPSMYLRERIKTSGIAAYESRYEAEVFWGNGPKPNVKQYRPDGGGGVP